jgi:lipopolysaccharide transport system permease protein
MLHFLRSLDLGTELPERPTLKPAAQHFFDLILVLTQKDLKVRYKSSYLGYLWSIAHPLALAFVFVVAFKVFMRIQMENYALFLIVGLFPWQWFSNSVNVTTTAFLANASIIKKVNFPRSIIPFTLVLQDMLHFVVSIPVIVLFMVWYAQRPSWSWLYGIPILLVIQFGVSYGVALAVSSMNLFFRDLERLMALLTTLMFYCTPVIYAESMIPPKYVWVLHLNPLAPIIISWRNLFLEGRLDWFLVGLGAGYAVLAVGLGYVVYRKLSWKFAEVL